MKKIISIIILINLLIFSVSYTTISAADDENENKKTVIPGGESFGIKMFSKGLIVTKLEGFKNSDKIICPAKNAGIEVNDIIVSANMETLNTSKEFKETIENSGGKEIEIKLIRNDKEINTTLTPQMNNSGEYKAGMWIKDSAAGLGTISFYHTESNSFCSLGHGICETNTGALMPLSFGEIDSAVITSVTKSSNTSVGTLNGYFTSQTIGTVKSNNEFGVYGDSTTIPYEKAEVEIADKNEVKKGNAYILTTTDESGVKEYDIKIKKIKHNNTQTNMIVEITDETLLEKTGGIVQGMSGSPIIQNGKLVGVITHVLVEDVKTGYAIFAETMYDKMMEAA